MGFSTFVTCLTLLSTTGWAQYVLDDNYMDGDFFSKFTFWDTADPTDGFVAYQDQQAAQSANLIGTSGGNVELRVDSTNVTPNGRPSVRLTSTQTYQSGLVIVDLEHMPGGVCGTWPAFWMVGPNWPNGGEIDIIEGVNAQTTNAMTLHTSSGCTISNSGVDFSGMITSNDCYVDAPGQANNVGCGISTANTQSYGAGFNQNGGGVYATEITSSYIAIWFFPRDSIPDDVNGNSPNPSGWGEPTAKFEGDCDFPSKFTNMQIVFDTTFCGVWAGDVWSSSSCSSQASTCNAFVENNPSAFTDAYWSIKGLRVYQSNGGSSPAPTSTSPVVSSAPAPSVPVGQSSAPVQSPSPSPSPWSPNSVPAQKSSWVQPTTFATSTAWWTPGTSVPAPTTSVPEPAPSPSGQAPWAPHVGGTGALSIAAVSQDSTPSLLSASSPQETPASAAEPSTPPPTTQTTGGAGAPWPTSWQEQEHEDHDHWDVGVNQDAVKARYQHLRMHKRHGHGPHGRL